MDWGAATGPDGRIYALGGFSDTLGSTPSSLEIYYPSVNSWGMGADLPSPRYGPAVVADGGMIYSIGGLDGGTQSPTAEVDAYDPTLDAWTPVEPARALV